MPSTRTKRVRAPTEIVEHDMSVPTVVKKRCDVPRNVDEKVPAYEPKEVLCQKRLINEEDNELDQIEEVDQLLADQQRMQCSDWECAQDADPVIKPMKILMEEYGDVATTKDQLLPELAEVKSLCQHWKLL